MVKILTTIEKRIRLSSDRADRLSRLAQTQAVSEDRVVEKALDALFSLTELLDDRAEWQDGLSLPRLHWSASGNTMLTARMTTGESSMKFQRADIVLARRPFGFSGSTNLSLAVD